MTKPDFPIPFEGDYYITNNLPYAERVALDPRWAKNGRIGGADWYTRIENYLPQDAKRDFEFFLSKI